MARPDDTGFKKFGNLQVFKRPTKINLFSYGSWNRKVIKINLFHQITGIPLVINTIEVIPRYSFSDSNDFASLNTSLNSTTLNINFYCSLI